MAYILKFKFLFITGMKNSVQIFKEFQTNLLTMPAFLLLGSGLEWGNLSYV